MRKESSHKLMYAVAGLAGLVAVMYGLYALEGGRLPGLDDRQAPEEAPVQDAQPASNPADPSGSDVILTCTAEDGSTFYTNAPDCASAELNNQLSVVDAWTPSRPAARPPDCLSDQYRDVDEAATLFLPRCREPFIEALRLEKRLASAADPVDSPRAPEYCAAITRGVASGCPATSQQFCYLAVCQALIERERENAGAADGQP